MKLRPPRGWRCKGIFVGGCVARGKGSSFRAKAHCHNDSNPKYPYFGWICVRALKRIGKYQLFCPDTIGTANYQDFPGKITQPSQLLLHEYAHLLAPGQGHTPAFYCRLKELGGHIDKNDRQYAPKATAKALASRKS